MSIAGSRPRRQRRTTGIDYRRALLLSCCATLCSACTQEPVELKILVSTEEPADTIAQAIIPLLEAEGFEASIAEVKAPADILIALFEGDAQLAVTEEPASLYEGLTTIVPLYPSVLHVMHRADLEANSFAQLLRGRNVYAGPPGGAAQRLLSDLGRDFNIAPSEYTLRDDPWTVMPDVYFVFGGLLDTDGVQSLQPYRLYGFGDADKLGRGTLAEGIALRYPNVRTFILPEGLYGSINAAPVLTLSIRAILLGSPHLSVQTSNTLIRTLIENAQAIATRYPLVVRELNPAFDPSQLVQPLHAGARRFVDRNEPGLLERYADVIALGLTLAAGFASGIVGLYRYGRQRRKDRVDIYYQRILDVRKRIHSQMSHEELRRFALEVRGIQEEVFALLIDESVSADETLTIFLDLSNQVLKELEPQLVG